VPVEIQKVPVKAKITPLEKTAEGIGKADRGSGLISCLQFTRK